MTNESISLDKPNEYEAEKASNSYLMSVLAIMVGLPFPIINLIATFIFFAGNRKGTLFVRWHCTQALFSQVLIVMMNSVGWSWTISILFGNNEVTNLYIGYILTIFIFNLTEFILTIYAAVETRKGKHLECWLIGPLTNMVFKIKNSDIEL
jgi:uncharacterized Tic20 family protein